MRIHVLLSTSTENVRYGRLFDRNPDKLQPRTLYRICVAAHGIIKEREEKAMNDAQLAPLYHPYQHKISRDVQGLH